MSEGMAWMVSWLIVLAALLYAGLKRGWEKCGGPEVDEEQRGEVVEHEVH